LFNLGIPTEDCTLNHHPMKRKGNHITVTLALAIMLVLSSCTPTSGFHPVSLLVGEGAGSTVISTVLLRLPGRILDATLTGMEARLAKHKTKHQKAVKQAIARKTIGLPIHTRIANPIPLKSDHKTEPQKKASNNNSPTITRGNTKPENHHQPDQGAGDQDAPDICRLK
jgi:hypothetical protein